MKDACKMWIGVLMTLTLVGTASGAGNDESHVIGPKCMYLPLEECNVWTYACIDGPVPLRCEVRVSKTFFEGKHEVFVLDGYLFGIAPGTIAFCEFDGGLQECKLDDFYMFYPWSDVSQPVEIPELDQDCMHGARGYFEREESIAVPAGRFDHALTVHYTDLPCCDAGPSSETFVAGVGLVQRKVMSFAGVRTWSLVYAEVGGEVFGNPSVDFTSFSPDPRRGSEPERPETWSGVKSRYR